MSKIFQPMADYIEMIFTNGATARDAGEALTQNDVIGFPITDVSANAEMALIVVCAKVKAKKNESLAINAGDALFYDSGDDNVNKSASGNTFVGFAIEDAALADEYVYMYFDGTRDYTRIGELDDIPNVDLTGATEGAILKLGSSNWEDGSLSLDDLSDVSVSGAAEGELLVMGASSWGNDTIGLEDLDDVDMSGPYYNGEFLGFKTDHWENLIINLDDLYDVDAGTPSDGQQLTWVDSSSKWEPAAAS